MHLVIPVQSSHLKLTFNYKQLRKMRLFQALLRRKGLPNGNIYSGKTRLVKTVTEDHIRFEKHLFQIEEKNLFYLRHPYLTLEQSKGHAKALGKADKRMEKIFQTKKPFKEHVTLESRLSHLRYREAWD